jgi:hypothetical protein
MWSVEPLPGEVVGGALDVEPDDGADVEKVAVTGGDALCVEHAERPTAMATTE